MIVADKDKLVALDTIVTELSRMQGLAKSVGETFVAFLIASAQREAAVRYSAITKPHA